MSTTAEILLELVGRITRARTLAEGFAKRSCLSKCLSDDVDSFSPPKACSCGAEGFNQRLDQILAELTLK